MRSDSSIELVLLVPGLLGPAAAGSGDREAAQALVAGLDLDALDRLLARAGHATTAAPAADDSLEALAFRAFGHLAPPAGADWPVAALTALVDACADQGCGFRLRADPVHLRADIDDLVLFDASDIDLSPDEAMALARTVNDALGPHGPHIDAAHPHRWYVAPDAPARIATTPLSRAAGARVSEALPRGPDAARWPRWMNEVQMALHECPVNVERERRGAVPVNSVWVWGAGSLPPAGDAPAPFVRVWTDDALLRGLARHSGVECGASPASANPASASPASANPAGANPASANPASANPASANPAGASAASANPASANPAGANPAGANPAGANPDRANPDRVNPAGAREWLDGDPGPGAHLVAFDDLYPAVRRADIDAWRAGLARLSRSWAQPLLDALDSGAVARVSIDDERGNRFTATRRGRFRWWRRAGLAARIAGARGPNA